MSSLQIDRRTYKYKQSLMKFFCPLCGTERAFTVGARLSWINYLQIIVATGLVTSLLFPFVGAKGLFTFFPIWATFELVRRALFKKEVPCPHCGFDATWYKRDVKKARQLVESFWERQRPLTQASNQEGASEVSHLSKSKEEVKSSEGPFAA